MFYLFPFTRPFGLLDIAEEKNWSLGPYLHHWNIGQSDTAIVYQNITPVETAWEPKIDTVEFGIKAGQQF